MRSVPQPPLTAEELHELQINVRQLSEETRLLRIAIDELRDDVVWAARNCLQERFHVGTSATPESEELPPVPTVASRTGPASIQGTSAPVAAKSEPAPNSPHEPASPARPSHLPAAPERVSTRTGRAPTGTKKPPLHTRLYYHEHLTAVTRAIGYAELDADEWQRRLAPLVALHGPTLIDAAVAELIEARPGRSVRLKPNVRPLAVGLLGRPPIVESIASAATPDQSPAAQQEIEAVPEKTSRHAAIQDFIAFLESRGVDYTLIDAAFRRQHPQHHLARLDLILPNGASNTLVTVQPKLKKQREWEIESWLSALGPARVLRVWPYRVGENRIWHEETVELPEPRE